MAGIIKLPDWAAHDPDDPRKVIADGDKAYGAWLRELEVTDEVDQYWLEVAFQCIKLEIQAAMGRHDLLIKITRAPRFALAKFPPGRGIAAATKGKEARAHFKRLRGFLPA